MASLGDINFTTKLSSAGLTYLHFGREVSDTRHAAIDAVLSVAPLMPLAHSLPQSANHRS
jgi:hypothetical protein